MLSESDVANLEEIKYALSHIELYVRPVKSLDELLHNNLIYDAVQMNFIIIGEASKRVSKKVREDNPQIDWKRIISYRNFVVHEYFGVDIKVLWGAITFELPKLKSEIEKILNK